MSATLSKGVYSLTLNIDHPRESDGVTPRDDLVGVKVWVSTEGAAFNTNNTNLVFDGNSLSVTIPSLLPGVAYFVKYALISDIEPSNYIVSSALTETPLAEAFEVDPSVPPAPTGFTATAGYSLVTITQDNPIFSEGFGYSYSILYGKKLAIGEPLPNFNTSGVVQLAEFTTNTFQTQLAAGSTYRLWLVWVSKAGIKSLPAGGTNGLSLVTTLDVPATLEALEGQITEDQFFQSLNERIDLIDDPTTGLVKKTDDLIITYGSTASAAQSAIDADLARVAAELAKIAAQTSETAASTSATNATTSATNAGNSATAAGNSATAASASEANAAGSASSASTSATNAATSATNAGNSATAAGNSATAASNSASNAAGSASSASTSESNAATSATNAGNSATAAGNSATAASNSASNAAGSASSASTSESNAATSATNAAGSAANALSYSNSASSSAVSAAGSASSAVTSLQGVQSTIRGGTLGLDFSLWTLNGQSLQTVSDGKVGNQVLRLSGIPGAYPNQGNYIALDPTKQYRVKFWARPVSAAGVLYFSLRQFVDNQGTAGPINGGRSPYKPSGQSQATHNSIYGSGAWGEYNYIWSSSDWQSGVKYIQPEFLDNYSGGSGYWEVQGFDMREVSDLQDVSAAVQQKMTARSSSDGSALAEYSLVVDANSRVAGFGLASSVDDASGAGSSKFYINADKFAVGSAGNDIVPFTVVTSTETVNGVSVPPGAYIDAAYIKNGTITSAKIGNATIDSAKIADLDANKINAGTLKVGGFLGSSTFDSSVGWRIYSDGSADFRGVVLSRNNVVASGIFGAGYVYSAGSGNETEIVLTGDWSILGSQLVNPHYLYGSWNQTSIGGAGGGSAENRYIGGPYFIDTGIPITAWTGGNSPLIATVGPRGDQGIWWTESFPLPESRRYWGCIAEVLPWTVWSGTSTIWIRFYVITMSMKRATNTPGNAIGFDWKLYQVS